MFLRLPKDALIKNNRSENLINQNCGLGTSYGHKVFFCVQTTFAKKVLKIDFVTFFKIVMHSFICISALNWKCMNETIKSDSEKLFACNIM